MEGDLPAAEFNESKVPWRVDLRVLDVFGGNFSSGFWMFFSKLFEKQESSASASYLRIRDVFDLRRGLSIPGACKANEVGPVGFTTAVHFRVSVATMSATNPLPLEAKRWDESDKTGPWALPVPSGRPKAVAIWSTVVVFSEAANQIHLVVNSS